MNATGICHGQHINPLGIDPNLRKSELAVQIAREILRRDGLVGYYRGYTASLLAYVPNSALWWGFYHFYQGEKGFIRRAQSIYFSFHRRTHKTSSSGLFTSSYSVHSWVSGRLHNDNNHKSPRHHSCTTSSTKIKLVYAHGN